MSLLSALLTQDKVVTPRKIDEAIQRQVISGGDFETNLLEVGAIAEDCLAGYAAHAREMIPARRDEIVESSLELIARSPRALLETIGAFPLRVEEGVVLLAVSAPIGEDALRDLERAYAIPVEPRYMNAARIAWAHHHHFDTPLASRTRRLVERLASLPPGEMPELAHLPPPPPLRRPGGAAASALATLDAALRDEDDPRTSSIPAPRSGEALDDPHQAPTSRPAPASAPPPRKTVRIDPPLAQPGADPPSTRPLPPQRNEGELINLRAARVPDARELLVGERTIDLDEARRALAEATDREAVVDTLLDHAAQNFSYVALFAVHGDDVTGIAARGLGVVGAPFRALGFSLNDEGAFARACRETRPVAADPRGLDRALATALRRPDHAHPRVFSIRLRTRVALLLWADDGERIPSEVAVSGLEAFIVECVAAFTRLILLKKRASRPAAPGTPSSLAPAPTIAPRRSVLPSVEARAAALRSAILVGERRSSPPSLRPKAARASKPPAAPAGGEPNPPPALAGEPELSQLMQSFPGPHRIVRAAAGARLPRASEQGAVLQGVVSAGASAIPWLLPVLGDPDPERRYCALLCVAELFEPSVVAPVAALLTDVDYPTRMAALEVLRRHRALPVFDAVWPSLRATALDPGATLEARRAAAYAAGELRDAGSVSALIELLGERDAALVAAARRALVELTRQDFGTDVDRWLGWWSTASRQHRIEWLIDALTLADATIRHEAAEELKTLTGQVFGYYFNLPRRERERAQQRYRAWWEAEGVARFASKPSTRA